MKHKKVILLLSLFVGLIFSCSTDMIVEPQSESSAIDFKRIEDMCTIQSIGLDTTDISEYSNYYIVEGDIMINKDSLKNFVGTRQYHTTNTVKNGQFIYVGVDSAISKSSAWVAAIKDVIDIYTEYTGLYFFYNSTGSATIRFSKKAVGSSYTCAQGEFPASTQGMPGANIYINTAFYQDIDSYLTHEQKVFLLAHEMGHNLGLRHTNCAINGEGTSSYGMIQIPGTPAYDDDSFMNSSTCGNTWTGMPKYDEVALAYLFPVTSNHRVHFANCTGVSDDYFPKGTKYYLNRYLIPKKDSLVFAGWHHTGLTYAPCRYDYAIESNKVVYARWRKSTEKEILGSFHSYAGNSSVMKIKTVSPVVIRVTVSRGENTWNEIKAYNDTYFRISGSSLSEYTINMEDKMNVPDSVQTIEYKDSIVLDEGDYECFSNFTSHLGSQRNKEDKHGYVYTFIESF